MAAPRILWVDCVGAAAAGAAMLALREWISGWYAWPMNLVVAVALVNLAYASYSFSLAIAARRTVLQVLVLVLANAAWAALCLVMAVVLEDQASAFGLAHLVGEGLYVGGLAALEWRQREALVTVAPSRSADTPAR